MSEVLQCKIYCLIKVNMYALETPLPTKLKRVACPLEPAVYDALVRYAARSKRSLSNSVALFVEQMLITTGDLVTPIPKIETRGGFREGSGRKPRTESSESDQTDDSAESSSDENEDN
ncbi:hypothetical protein K9N68_33795 [Kovacikia minuta CCNUW1]|uniref:hypothetical protein n=1 Tax=Kovacikia minuta TaxID=2931930 RepID=UPI001CCE7AA8|nr:hypothetical protein [Kovacikia minuta]UBF26417.1 hypothetical protein K9N68_33795 [Kovacikia minuta CCNUW1]